LNETSFDPNKVVPDISWLKNIDTILMHWMRVKSADNLQIREHSWPRLFHIRNIVTPVSKANQFVER